MREMIFPIAKLVVTAALAFATLAAKAEDPYALKCQSADGSRQFAPVRPPYALLNDGDKNAFYALIRTLGITREQYETWDVRCVQIMGLKDPRPYSPELRDKEFRKEHAACLPPNDVVAKPHGGVLYKVSKGCTEALTKQELAYVVGVISIGIEDCEFSSDRTSRVAYGRAMLALTPAMMVDFSIQPQLLEGQTYAKNLQCNNMLKELTAKGVSHIQSR